MNGPDDLLERGSWVGGQRAPVALAEAPRLRAFTGNGLVAVIAASVLVGVGLTVLWTEIIGPLVRRAATGLAVTAPVAGGRDRIAPATLTGPRASFTFPPSAPTVVHVWLQGCPDCMPAFEAQKRAHDDGAYAGTPVVNVAYGRADESWAEAYGVADTLVFDDGSHVVSPLGIGTFTTLVVDTDGDIRLWDRPDRAGFSDRVKGALEAIARDARCRHDVDEGASGPPSSRAN